MNIRKLKYGLGIVVMTIVAAVAMPSCTDERFDLPDYTVSGADVTISVPIHFPEMDNKTRASLDESSLNQVESLWIRTYSADTGEATSDWLKLTPGTNDAEEPHNVTLNTKSGSSYIVGVANVDNMGVTKDDIATQKPLRELLDAADSWSQFLNISVVSPSSFADVYAPVPPLPMAGCFTNIQVKGEHPDASNLADWQNRDFQAYFIPAQKGTFDLTDGAIHLRRLVSHLTFNIIPADGLEVTVNSYQVGNAPKYSWLYERPANQVLGEGTNFGDLATSQEDAANYYADIPQYGSQYIGQSSVTIDGVERACSTFDFWQAENKHTGLEACDTYQKRDKVSESDKTLFTSLTGDTWTTNNEASYVLISCTVDYDGQINVGNEGQILGDGTPGGTPVYRTGNATYLVHLGYIGNSEVATRAKDFNCYRNVNYTYNLHVNGLNDIRLDAWADDETYHGEEGLVSDLQYATIELDAHYHAFNIQLTQAELEERDFGFIITTYENGNMITLSDKNEQRGTGVSNKQILEMGSETVIPAKYYNWIELRPADGPDELQEYKPRYGGNADGKTFLLSDLKGGWNAMTANMRSTTGWYTVFVNEYTYEPMYTGSTTGYANEQWDGNSNNGKPQWMGYVNQNPRRFYIRVTQSTSPDGKSVYSRSKYGISQNSIQTYYSDNVFTPLNDDDEDNVIPPGTAIGIERVNESEGLNLRHNFAGGNSLDNGRWNVAQWLQNDNTVTQANALSINSANEDNHPIWSSFIDQTAPMEVGAVNDNRAQGGLALPARTIEVGNPVKLPKVNTLSDQTATFNDPQGSGDYFIEAINACMSRNRDNNGNGRIEPDELRWYVPAMGKYLRLIIGRNSLTDPLMDYSKITKLPYVGNNNWASTGSIANDYYSRYMFIASNSDRCVLWGMEGTSTSSYDAPSTWTGTTIRPWQVRCIRNLGSDMRTVTPTEKVTMAYKHDDVNRTFKMLYYDVASKRPNAYTSNGTGGMPLHDITSPYNMVYSGGFKYDTENISVSRTDLPSITEYAGYINGNPCAARNTATGETGWRIPNQKELTIMRNAGLFSSYSGRPNTTWLTCTVNYFAYDTGVGNTSTVNKRLLIITPSQGTQLTQNNYDNGFNENVSNGVFIRCVKDI